MVFGGNTTRWRSLVDIKLPRFDGNVLAGLGEARRNRLEDKALVLHHFVYCTNQVKIEDCGRKVAIEARRTIAGRIS